MSDLNEIESVTSCESAAAILNSILDDGVCPAHPEEELHIFCRTDRSLMCLKCSLTHCGHDIITFDSIESAQALINEMDSKIECASHQGVECLYFCLYDYKPVCHQCCVKACKDHTIKELPDVTSTIRNEIASLCKLAGTLPSFGSESDEALKRYQDAVRRRLSKNKEMDQKKTQEMFLKIRQNVDEKEKEFVRSINEYYEKQSELILTSAEFEIDSDIQTFKEEYSQVLARNKPSDLWQFLPKEKELKLKSLISREKIRLSQIKYQLNEVDSMGRDDKGFMTCKMNLPHIEYDFTNFLNAQSDLGFSSSFLTVCPKSKQEFFQYDGVELIKKKLPFDNSFKKEEFCKILPINEITSLSITPVYPTPTDDDYDYFSSINQYQLKHHDGDQETTLTTTSHFNYCLTNALPCPNSNRIYLLYPGSSQIPFITTNGQKGTLPPFSTIKTITHASIHKNSATSHQILAMETSQNLQEIHITIEILTVGDYQTTVIDQWNSYNIIYNTCPGGDSDVARWLPLMMGCDKVCVLVGQKQEGQFGNEKSFCVDLSLRKVECLGVAGVVVGDGGGQFDAREDEGEWCVLTDGGDVVVVDKKQMTFVVKE